MRPGAVDKTKDDSLGLSGAHERGDHSRDELAILDRAALAIHPDHSPDQLCNAFMEAVADGMHTSFAAVLLAEKAGRLRVAASSGIADAAPWHAITELATESVTWGHSLLAPYPEPSSEGAAPGRGSREGLLVTPIRMDGRIEGAMVLARNVPATPFDRRDLSLAAVLSTQLALAIDRIRAREALEARGEAADLLQRQLQAYAIDIRRTFTAEKQRAEQLGIALDQLKEAYLATVRTLSIAVEAKDADTGGHLKRVTRYGMAMLRLIAPEQATDPQFEYGFFLHDIGKLGVPDAVLSKPGKLTDEEWVLIRRHPETGARILGEIPFLAAARKIVFGHHEWWDGTGYPLGLRGDQIPLGARMFPIADSFDAMTSNRPYRRAMSIDQALEQVRTGCGTQFWPEAVEAFLSISSEELQAASEGPYDWRPVIPD
jgi:HD-GYP domain-containing protein (c-di-GMP phosphodiesterase class II)